MVGLAEKVPDCVARPVVPKQLQSRCTQPGCTSPALHPVRDHRGRQMRLCPKHWRAYVNFFMGSLPRVR